MFKKRNNYGGHTHSLLSEAYYDAQCDLKGSITAILTPADNFQYLCRVCKILFVI
jgi:hypothetical protein